MMFKVVTETLGVVNVLRTPIYAATVTVMMLRFIIINMVNPLILLNPLKAHFSPWLLHLIGYRHHSRLSARHGITIMH